MLVILRTFVLASLVTLLLASCGSPVPPQVVDPGQEAALKSVASDSKAQITFVNKSGQEVKVYWLDFSGHRVLYQVLRAGESYDQQTYLTHPWLVTDSSDNGWNIFFAGSEPSVVYIAAPTLKQS